MITKAICLIFPIPEDRDKIALFLFRNIKLYMLLKSRLIMSILPRLIRYLAIISNKTSLHLVPKSLINAFDYYVDEMINMSKKIEKLIDILNSLFNIPKYLQ